MIIPRPAELTVHPGEFAIPAALHLSAGPGAARAADLLAGYLGDRPRASYGPAVRVEIAPADLPYEGYRLEISPPEVLLTAPGEEGLFHGVQTLRQLLPPAALDPASAPPDAWRWPCVTVRDAPRLPWRGVMLDVARHYMPPEFLEEFIDRIALHKLNVLHLHLTDDQGWRIEIEGLPRLTEVGAWRTESMVGPSGSTRFDGVPHGGFYSQRRLRDLVAYAARRGVTIVPEIEMPGHARALLAAYPHLGNRPEVSLPVWTSWGISEDILGVHDEALEFCRTVLAQTVSVFPSRYVHIGGEECPTTQWETSPVARRRAAELGFTTPTQLHGWFLRQMQETLTEHGRRAVCWDEAEQNGELPADMTLTAWRDPGHGVRSVERGHQVIMAPHRSTYLDYAQSTHPGEPPAQPDVVTTVADVYGFDPLAGGLPVADPGNGGRPGVLGTQAQLWTEFVPTPDHVRYLTFPRLCALAEAAWSEGTRDYEEFQGRLTVHRERLRVLGALPGRDAA
ncbi:beta-N-acetylhexosaminidase [Actinoallomurus vinaceus]|uniref:beta-N-acetylhexosaminidase n=1 Tax=Actinoallomurus vinaceus TaxID=1080074 RepID=A0ABP8UX57_9ACTN